jgi:hypothetical protein
MIDERERQKARERKGIGKEEMDEGRSKGW